MNKQRGNAGAVIIVWLFVVIPALLGWIMNIVKIVHSDFAHIGGMLVVRIVGIFVAPLGAVLGYF